MRWIAGSTLGSFLVVVVVVGGDWWWLVIDGCWLVGVELRTNNIDENGVPTTTTSKMSWETKTFKSRGDHEMGMYKASSRKLRTWSR